METVILCFYRAHCERKLQDSVKFQLETFSFFFQPQPEFVLELFLIFGQHEQGETLESFCLNKQSEFTALQGHT